MTPEGRLRAWRWARQGLGGGWSGETPGSATGRSGWIRSVGGANPYLSLFVRAGVRRAEADAAVAAEQVLELPAARGCTYVVPAEQFGLALSVGAGPAASREVDSAVRLLGYAIREHEALERAVVEALSAGAREPAELRTTLGERVRDFGDAGRKRGISSALPLVLGTLQARGEIVRESISGRLDRQRYRYRLWRPGPGARPEGDDAAFEQLAGAYFGWAGAASLAGFAAFAGASKTRAAKACAPLGLVELDAAQGGSGLLARPREVRELAEFQAPGEPCYSLVSALDSFLLLPGSAPEPGREAPGAGGGAGHAILDRGEPVGEWEFDPEAGKVVWAGPARPDDALREAIARVEAFIAEDLGDCRSFSLDSPESRRPRLAALRARAATG